MGRCLWTVIKFISDHTNRSRKLLVVERECIRQDLLAKIVLYHVLPATKAVHCAQVATLEITFRIKSAFRVSQSTRDVPAVRQPDVLRAMKLLILIFYPHNRDHVSASMELIW